MSVKIWDSTLSAWKDAETPKIYGGGAFGDSTGKVWNGTEQAWQDAWGYSNGTTEADLLHNLKYINSERVGKVYYIQGYCYDSNSSSSSIIQNVPYKVIGINHDGTTNTIDLQSYCSTNNMVFNSGGYNSWTYGKYSASQPYSWIVDTCKNGFSSSIQAKMCNMTERWREATGNTSGSLQTRTTKIKLLNPYELFGSSIDDLTGPNGEKTTDFTSYNYGQFYSDAFLNTIDPDTRRERWSTSSLGTQVHWWTNSWHSMQGGGIARVAFVWNDGSAGYGSINPTNSIHVCPVIRLSDNPT